MYALVHITGALTAGIGRDYYRKKTIVWEKKYFLLLIASMIPDIVDKTIGAFIFKTGRWIGHTLVFIVIITVIYYLLAYKREERKEKSLMILLGGLMHFLLDLPGISLNLELILWPLFGFNIPIGRTEAFLEGGVTPIVIGTEFIALIILLLLAWKMRFDRKQYSLIGVGVVSYITMYIALYTIIIGF